MRPLNFILSLFAISICFSACKLDAPILPGHPGYVAVVPPGGGTGTGTGNGTGISAGVYYFKGTIGTQAFNWQVTDDASGWIMGYVSANGSGFESLFLNTDTAQLQSIDIQFVNNTTPAPGEDSVTYFNNYIPTGAWAFGAQFADLSTLKKTVYISYTDSKGNSYVNADVQTSSLTVVSATPVAATGHFSNSLKIRVTFSSCVLKPQDASLSSITLSNADATFLLEDPN